MTSKTFILEVKQIDDLEVSIVIRFHDRVSRGSAANREARGPLIGGVCWGSANPQETMKSLSIGKQDWATNVAAPPSEIDETG